MSSQSPSVAGVVRRLATPVAATTVSICLLSSNRSSSKQTENVFCRSPTLPGFSARRRALIRAVIVEESMPPERQVPTGTSLLSRSRTASARRSRSPRAVSSSPTSPPGASFTAKSQ